MSSCSDSIGATPGTPASLPSSASQWPSNQGPTRKSSNWVQPDKQFLGSYDKPTLRRGFLVYMDTCSGCHSLRHVAYRDLTALGVGFAPEDIKGLAAQFKIED